MQTQFTETLPKTRCTPAMRLALETMAINQDCSMSDIVRVAVHNHVDSYYRNAAGQGPAGMTPSSSETVETTGQSQPEAAPQGTGRRLAS